MIRTETHERTITRTTVVSVTCDRCGRETFTPYKKHSSLDKTGIGDGWVDGGHVTLGDFNYGSLLDGLYKQFDICDDCAPKLIEWFEKAETES